MSFPFEAIFSLGGKLLDIIGRFVPDKAKAQELAAEVQRAVAAAMQAEMASQWLVGQWRAIAMLILTGAIAWRYVTGSLDFVGSSSDLSMGIIWLVGFTGYGLTIDNLKVIMSVLKPKKGDVEENVKKRDAGL